MSNKRFLFIHYHYPPIRNSGVYRNYYLSTALTELTDNACLITTDNRKYLPNEVMEIHPNITRREALTLDYRRIVAWLNGKKSKAGAQFSERTKKSHIMVWAIKIQRSFPFNLVLAEGALLYIINGYRIGNQLIKEQKVNVIYSSFMPYADHVIAYFLKKKNPNIQWVADFRDLHVEPIYKNTIWPSLQRWVEKKLLQNADLITCVSEGISNKMRAYHPKVLTITKGVTPRSLITQYDVFTIAYSGSLFLDFRDPKLLFQAISALRSEGKLQKIQIIYAGKDSSTMMKWAADYGVNEVFVDKGFVSREEALSIQDRSHINLLLTSSSPEHQGLLTGKLFEYFEAGNPVICIVKGVQDSELENIFTELNAGHIAYDPSDISTLKNFILSKYHEWEATGEVAQTIDHQKLKNSYSWEGQALKLLSAIQ